MVQVISGDSVAKLTSIATEGKERKHKPFPDGESTLKVKIADLPKEAKRVIKANMTSPKEFRVRLNEDGDEVETVTPARGVFTNCKLIGLGPKDADGKFRPMIHKVYNEGTDKENAHDEFIAIYEIQDGPFKGVQLPGYYLHYKYEEVPEGEEDEGMTQYNTVDTPQASQLHKLQAWERTHGGIVDEPIEWPDDGDIRPTLEERALENDVTVTLVFENGYIDSVQATETYDVDDEESVEEFDKAFPEPVAEVVEVPAKAKKTTKKSKKVEEDEL